MCGSRRYELPSRLQNGQAQFASVERSRILKALLHPVQSEFRSLVIRVDTICFDDSAGDNQKSRAGHKVTASRALHRVREQSQRQPGGLERRDPRVMTKQPRRVARIGIAHRPQVFLVTTDERRTTAKSAVQNG